MPNTNPSTRMPVTVTPLTAHAGAGVSEHADAGDPAGAPTGQGRGRMEDRPVLAGAGALDRDVVLLDDDDVSVDPGMQLDRVSRLGRL